MPVVRDAPDKSRFEIVVDDDEIAGFARYVLKGGRVVFVHTEVDDRFEGQGLGSQLVAGALDQVRASGRKIVPLCPFVASYIERHPAYADLVDAHLLRAFDEG